MTAVEPLLVECGPVDKTFRRFQPDQLLLVPPSLDEWLPQEHLARFIADLVDEHLDLSGFYADYRQGRGGPPFDPRLMVRVLLLGYTTGIRSSRKLEAACWDIVAFRWLAGGQAPAYRAIAKFRKRHLSALGICSCRPWSCARPLGCSAWAGSPWTARRCGRTPRGARR